MLRILERWEMLAKLLKQSQDVLLPVVELDALFKEVSASAALVAPSAAPTARASAAHSVKSEYPSYIDSKSPSKWQPLVPPTASHRVGFP